MVCNASLDVLHGNSSHKCRWQNGQSDLGHALVAFDVMANTLSHPRVDVAHFWTTRWRFGGFSPSNNKGSVADALWVCAFTVLGLTYCLYLGFGKVHLSTLTVCKGSRHVDA